MTSSNLDFAVDNLDAAEVSESSLTPREIVSELDKYIIAQQEAKRAVAIALRNRWRRLQVQGSMRDEITPKNIIMVGPTGVGKTEISRRLAKLDKAPFVKVEASKFTEVGYVGRDVESIVRELAEVSHSLVKKEQKELLRAKAQEKAEELLLDALLPSSGPKPAGFSVDSQGEAAASDATREKLRAMLREGKLEERTVEIELSKQVHAHLEVLGPPGMAEIEGQIKDMFTNMVPKQKDKRKVLVKEARELLIAEAADGLLDMEEVNRIAVKRAEQSGIVFIDEIDKVCGANSSSKGPDVSREGVQRDLLPLVEGCTVSTKYGPIKTDHVLFIASGAFHHATPADLMPEFQGRFPIRVELQSLTAEHFVKILTEPENALIKQYQALLATEGVALTFTEDAILEIAKLTASVNTRTENIGARRLHTILERLLEQLSYEACDVAEKKVVVDQQYVQQKLGDIAQDADLSRFIL